MRISEVKGERSLDVMADLMEIFENEKISEAFKKNENSKALRIMLKEHRSAVYDLIAATQGVEPDKANVSIKTLSDELAKIFNDPEMWSLFTSQENNATETL